MPKAPNITEQFMATDIIMQPVSTLIPYANNARTHSDAQIKQIAASIQAFGFTNPVLVDGQNGIIAGHGRILAAELIGITEVPTICLPHLTNTAKRAYVLADNRIAINSGWDMETLAVEVQRIIDDGRYDVGDLGFDATEVDEMLASIINGQGGQPLTDPDDVPELPSTPPKSQRGDIWLCGEHRVMCGDSTDKADVDVLMDGKRVGLVLTDMPYGIGKDGIENDNLKGDQFTDFNDRYITALPAEDNCGLVCYHSTRTFNATINSAVSLGWKFEKMLFFYRPDKFPVHVWNGWMMTSQAILLFSVGKPEYKKIAPAEQDVYRITSKDLVEGKVDHPTVKPVENVRALIEHYTAPLIYDPFLGSGTTLIACQSTGRLCYGMEISPAYVDVIVNRWQNFTGLNAVNANTGLSFNDTATTSPDTQEASNAL